MSELPRKPLMIHINMPAGLNGSPGSSSSEFEADKRSKEELMMVRAVDGIERMECLRRGLRASVARGAIEAVV